MVASTVASNGNIKMFPERRSGWKRLRVLLRKVRTVNISSTTKQISIQGESSTSSTESIRETVIRETVVPKGEERRVQKALVVASKGQYKILHDFPMPHIGEGEVMIRSHFVGLNPIDWKSVDYNFCLPSFPWVSESDTPALPGLVVNILIR